MENQDRLPFAVARSSRATLVEQVAEGLRRAIDSGFYKPGDVLPTTRGLADALGVSRIVTRAAVRELAEAGLINPKPSVGSVVLGRHGKLWRGNILFVQRSNGLTYYINAFAAALRARLVAAGWLFAETSVVNGSQPGADTSELELQLSHPVTLALVLFDNPAAERILSRSGVPFVTLGNGATYRRKGCVGHVHYNRSAASAELAAAAVEAGVKTALQVGWGTFDDVGAAFRKVGIRFSKWNIAVPSGGRMPEAASFAVRDAVAERLEKGAIDLPDLIYFHDDHACTGALAALAAAGLRVPEDVRIATWSNLGNGPIYARELTRAEMDPLGDADKVAAAVLAWLEGSSGAFPLTLGPTFRRGETL